MSLSVSAVDGRAMPSEDRPTPWRMLRKLVQALPPGPARLGVQVRVRQRQNLLRSRRAPGEQSAGQHETELLQDVFVVLQISANLIQLGYLLRAGTAPSGMKRRVFRCSPARPHKLVQLVLRRQSCEDAHLEQRVGGFQASTGCARPRGACPAARRHSQRPLVPRPACGPRTGASRFSVPARPAGQSATCGARRGTRDSRARGT